MYYRFSCNWDTSVIFTTVVTLLITVVVIFLSFKTYETYRRRGKNFMAIIAITAVWILPIAGIVSFMYMPTSVTVDDRNLILRQIKGNITIPISEIVEVRQICPDDMKDGRTVWLSWMVRESSTWNIFDVCHKQKQPFFSKRLSQHIRFQLCRQRRSSRYHTESCRKVA